MRAKLCNKITDVTVDIVYSSSDLWVDVILVIVNSAHVVAVILQEGIEAGELDLPPSFTWDLWLYTVTTLTVNTLSEPSIWFAVFWKYFWISVTFHDSSWCDMLA